MPVAAPQADFPQTCFLPPEARPIGSVAGVMEDEQGGVCFLYGWANGCWDQGDDLSRRLAALQLVRVKAATRREVADGFGTTPATLWRWDKAYQQEGPAGLLRERPGPKRPSKLTPERALEIRDLRGQGLSLRRIAAHTGLSVDTVHRALDRPSAPVKVLPPRQPAALPVIPPPEPRQEERELARTGALEEAPPVFTQGRELPLLGLLLALPALARTSASIRRKCRRWRRRCCRA